MASPAMFVLTLFLHLLLQSPLAKAAFDLGIGDDSDLTYFISRPEIRFPRFNVSNYHPEEIIPGYWFLTPYASITQENHAKKYLQACSTGPAIYDSEGQLVWTGACQVRNQNGCDFRAFHANGTDFLSAILPKWGQIENAKGYGIVWDNHYSPVTEVHPPKLMMNFNMHEFNVVDNGKGGQNALYITQRPVVVDLDLYDQDFEDMETGLINDLGIMEVELSTGDVVFQWWASDHISISESDAVIDLDRLEGPWPGGHLNSIDQSPEGDYLISSRYTDSLYKISGATGTLLWTLSGQPRNSKFSTFALSNGLNFSRQHDARFLSSTPTTETITFMDNGGDENIITANISSSLVVTLDHTTRTASVDRRWLRPGNQRSQLRGNFQLLPNGNAFTGWSDNCHLSEHNWEGKLLMEASFACTRFVTYRAWKGNFTGSPTETPALKAYVYGTTRERSTTAMYVSWNGVTEVGSWKFLRVGEDGAEEVIAAKKRTGFETAVQVDGYEGRIVAEAVARDGVTVIGRSEVCVAEITSEELRGQILGEHMRPVPTVVPLSEYSGLRRKKEEDERRRESEVKTEL